MNLIDAYCCGTAWTYSADDGLRGWPRGGSGRITTERCAGEHTGPCKDFIYSTNLTTVVQYYR